MTSYTSDERREVAAWLRMEVSEEECLDYAICRIINDVLGVNGAWGAKAAHILADLIDPTCEVSDCGHPDRHTVVNECMSCHAGWYEDVYDKPFAYCPRCGSRVVSDDGE